jgi:GH35 family endo-1,4-beta-xylanase
MAALDKHKIKPLFILDYGNPIHSPGEFPFTDRMNTPEVREAFARWAAAAVTHFKGRGILWEIWNEPNHPGFWKPQPNVEDYIQLAQATAKAVRAAAPGEALIARRLRP